MAFLCLKCGMEDDEEICDECLMKEVFNEYEYCPLVKERPDTPDVETDNQIALELCNEILEWSEKIIHSKVTWNLDFNTDFVVSVKKWITDGNDCSVKQYLALHNIIDKFNIKI